MNAIVGCKNFSIFNWTDKYWQAKRSYGFYLFE